MSDAIKHECGIALIRLRKPYQYYIDKYGTPLYAANKLYLLMEKQVNRGQDGAGIANIKLDVPAGSRYISRYRSVDQRPVTDIFEKVNKKIPQGTQRKTKTKPKTQNGFRKTWPSRAKSGWAICVTVRMGPMRLKTAILCFAKVTGAVEI